MAFNGDEFLNKTGLDKLWTKIKALIYVMQGAGTDHDGKEGYVPKPYSSDSAKFLRGDGTWADPQDTQYSEATSTNAGLMPASDKAKLDDLMTFKTVKVAGTSLTADSVSDTLTITAGNNVQLTPTASSDTFSISATDTTYDVANSTSPGLMSADMYNKLNGMSSTQVTGVKGDSESTYRTGQVNITPADLGITVVNNTADANKSVASAATLTTARTLDGVSFNGSANIIHWGTCSVAAGTAAKTVALTGFNLTTGARVAVKFTNGNTAANPTLNVNSKGAKAIKYKNSGTVPLLANCSYEFVYDGTQFQLIGELDTNTIYSAATASADGLLTSTLYSKLTALPTNSELQSTYALKTDITSVMKYKGSVTAAQLANLSGQSTGDMYNITDASDYGDVGTNVAWNGTGWDPMGSGFSVVPISLDYINALS